MRFTAFVLAGLLFACHPEQPAPARSTSPSPDLSDAGVPDAGSAVDAGGPTDAGVADAGPLGDGPVPDAGLAIAYGDACNAEGWCWENPLPQGNEPNAVYAAGDDDVWVAGEHGMLVHWDGKTVESFAIAKVNLNGLWGAGPDDVWVVGDGGFTAHWDGLAWTPVAAGSEDLHAVHGAAGEIWAVGARATALRWTGTTWEAAPPGPASNAEYTGVWLDGPSDVWLSGGCVVKSGGGIDCLAGTGLFHFDGSGWTQWQFPVCADWNCTWTFSSAFHAIWGRSATDVWATTLAGGRRVIHWDGTEWSWSTIEDNECTALGGTAEDTWCFSYLAMSSFESGAWTRDFLPPVSTTPVSVSGAPSQIWVVGRKNWGAVVQSAILRRDATGTWTNLVLGPEPTLTSVWGSGPADVWVGGDPDLLHFDGVSWRALAPFCAPWGSQGFRGGRVVTVAGSGPSDVWVGWLCWNGGAEFAHWDGSKWEQRPMAAYSLDAYYVSSIWVSAPNDAWAAGGPLSHWDGATWTPVDVGAPAQLYAVWGRTPTDVWAAGEKTVAHWNGKQWSATTLGGTGSWGIGPIWASGPADVWVAGYDYEHPYDGYSHSLMWHFDGSGWTQVTVPDIGGFSAITGTSASDVYAAGTAENTVLHWDGSEWTAVDTGSPRLMALWSVPGFETVAVGEHGSILHHRVGR